MSKFEFDPTTAVAVTYGGDVGDVKVGTQVAYFPHEGAEPEYGFVTALGKDSTYFVRYWRRSAKEPTGFEDLRTKSRSVRTPAQRLYHYAFADQSAVEAALDEIFGVGE